MGERIDHSSIYAETMLMEDARDAEDMMLAMKGIPKKRDYNGGDEDTLEPKRPKIISKSDF